MFSRLGEDTRGQPGDPNYGIEVRWKCLVCGNPWKNVKENINEDISFKEEVIVSRETICPSCKNKFDSSGQEGTYRKCSHCGNSWGTKNITR